MNPEKLSDIQEALRKWDEARADCHNDCREEYDHYRGLLVESGKELIEAAIERDRLKHLCFPPPERCEFEEDWDAFRGKTRIAIKMPVGCTCYPNAIAMIVSCPVHVTYVRGDYFEWLAKQTKAV